MRCATMAGRLHYTGWVCGGPTQTGFGRGCAIVLQTMNVVPIMMDFLC